MPETMAENRNTTGISGEDHHGFAFTEPKMKPDITVQQERRRNADDGDMLADLVVDPQRALGLMLFDPRVSAR